mgnify:CR=1 FL=1
MGVSAAAYGGQSFSNQKINATTLSARMSFTKLGAIVPYVALSRNIAESDAFTEVGTGANLNVGAAKQSDVTAEVGMGYGIKLDDHLAVSDLAAQVKRGSGSLGDRADAVSGERHGLAEDFFQLGGGGIQRQSAGSRHHGAACGDGVHADTLKA